jgi:uncharacterized membrane protein YbaN (DUF454 family)
VGTICVILATIGIFLPILPTTPLLLLAAYFYARSSTRFYNWLMTNRWFGEYIRNYREGRGISMRNKLISWVFLWGTILYAAFFVAPHLWLKILLISIALSVTIHLARVKTYQPEIKQTQVVKDFPIADNPE